MKRLLGRWALLAVVATPLPSLARPPISVTNILERMVVAQQAFERCSLKPLSLPQRRQFYNNHELISALIVRDLMEGKMIRGGVEKAVKPLSAGRAAGVVEKVRYTMAVEANRDIDAKGCSSPLALEALRLHPFHATWDPYRGGADQPELLPLTQP